MTNILKNCHYLNLQDGKANTESNHLATVIKYKKLFDDESELTAV